MAASKSLSPEQRSMRARMAAHAMHSQHDTRQTSANGRASFLRRFLDEVDPDRQLPEAERLRRAEQARKRYFAQLAFRSSRARQRKAGGADA